MTDLTEQLPFEGYDRLDTRQITQGLHAHTQVELGAVETYERSHQNRKPVLDKLRYMRGAEPFGGYDELSIEEVVSAIEDVDLKMVKKVLGYERKFANRADVIDAVATLQKWHLEHAPKVPPPSYQPMSAKPAKG